MKTINMKPITKLTLGSIVLGASLLATALTANQCYAITYNVNRSWSNGFRNASLSGTVDILVGNYIVTEGFSNPFTKIALLLTTPDGTFSLDGLNNRLVSGTGQFLITADSTSLVFSTVNFNGENPADLLFTETGTGRVLYAIGSDGSPQFEVSFTRRTILSNNLSFPTTFGTAIAVPWETDALPVFFTTIVFGCGLWAKCNCAQKNNKNLS
jgi:hypothetical protein